MHLWLVGAALAAEPDLSGVNVALGAGLTQTVDLPYYTGGASRLAPLVRLHVGPRVLAELSGGAGRVREQDVRQEWEPDEESGPLLADYEQIDIEGWRWSAGGRLAVRLGGGDVHHYAGASGTYGRRSSVGPWYQEVPTEDLTALEPGEVGERTETAHEYAVAVGWTAVHWVTERVSLSAGLDVPLYGLGHRETAERSNGTIPDLEDSLDVDHEQELGGAPVATLAVHLRL